MAAGNSVRVRGSVSDPSRLLPLLDLCASGVTCPPVADRLTNNSYS